MINKIPYTSYSGWSSQLSSKGEAVEFLQPWYTPISTTPENTGMAVGGIGSTFTLTPQGTTPNFSFIPGIYVDSSEEKINFNDFYISVMDAPEIDNLDISNLADLQRFNEFYPASFCGKRLVVDDIPHTLERIRTALKSLDFYLDNQEAFSRWNIAFTDHTQRLIELEPRGLNTQVSVAIDFFNGLIINQSARALALSPHGLGSISSVNPDAIHYQALYPLAQYQYHSFDKIRVERNVVSPIVKGDKKLCSLPVHWNQFTLTNDSEKTQRIVLAQPLENLIGSTYQKLRHGMQDSACRLVRNTIKQCHSGKAIHSGDDRFVGVSLCSDSPYPADIEGEMLYGAVVNSADVQSGKVVVSVKPSVYMAKLEQELIASLNTGRTNAHFDAGTYSGREPLAALVVVQIELQPGETFDLRFLQIMDHSKIWLDDWRSEKAYCQFFTEKERATRIAEEVLPQLKEIEARIVQQQVELLDSATRQIQDASCATRFATMAMNTLSFLAESTVWDRNDRFLVKECVDYPFFNSLDVYFYGSFAILYLLPELDGKVMEAFAQAILTQEETPRRYWEYADRPYADLTDHKYAGVRAEYGAVIHDLGSPFDIKPDAYHWHNVKEWKDLAPKFILMVYRHYQQTGNKHVVEACWPAVQESINYLSSLIEEGDSLPLVHGTDDTFDNLSSHGIAIYCASLWAAGLRVAGYLADIMGEHTLAKAYQQRSETSLAILEQSLWDERQGYYHFYATPIQVNHLTGKDFQPLAALGLRLCGDKVADKQQLNDYLNQVDENSPLSKYEQRLTKKQQLLATAPLAFSPEYQVMVLDSENSFGDALIADTYLKLMGLDGLFASERVSRTLDFIYQTNFLKNSPHLGVANMTLADGSPDEAFQAQDVWGGVQFSLASALKLSGKKQHAEHLLNTVYETLYLSAKIPFAAPEGFNGSYQVTTHDLMDVLSLHETDAQDCLYRLKNIDALRVDGRVNPDLRFNKAAFVQAFAFEGIDSDRIETLYQWLIRSSMKYTAGRYFRPGMIFAYLYC
ncbi:GH116 family glycosyl hydrolase [Vibrio sp. H11]|uniref:GH116 family glycosyl hydrolase n=1 Tax=Vibrio sp. H11 TaxID=2565928 RepID=UPI0010A615A8|nr:GH116 family glycosyl hydrolase [Vibrio sp. H11]